MKLEWSVDFLVMLLRKAAREDVAIKIENNGVILTLHNTAHIAVPQEPKDGLAQLNEYLGYTAKEF